jgi:hypothetical protein
MDPCQRADTGSNTYMRWWTGHVFAKSLQSLREFPPRQPASFNMEQVLQSLEEGQGG